MFAARTKPDKRSCRDHSLQPSVRFAAPPSTTKNEEIFLGLLAIRPLRVVPASTRIWERRSESRAAPNFLPEYASVLLGRQPTVFAVAL